MSNACQIKYDAVCKVYVSYTPILNIYSQGNTKVKAREALRDAIGSFLFVHFNLNKYFPDKGYVGGLS